MQKQHFIVLALENGDKMYCSGLICEDGVIILSDDCSTFRLSGSNQHYLTEGRSAEAILTEFNHHNLIVSDIEDELWKQKRAENEARKRAEAKNGFIRFKGDFTIEFKNESPDVNPLIAGLPLLIAPLVAQYYADKKKKESSDDVEETAEAPTLGTKVKGKSFTNKD